MATKEIRDALITVLDTVTVSGVVLTTAPRVPRGQTDYEGYVIMAYPASGGFQSVADTMLANEQRWTVRVVSPLLGTGLDAVREDAIYDIRDAIVQKLFNEDRLNDSRYLDDLSMIAERYQIPFPYDSNQYAVYDLTLQIQTTTERTC